MLKLYHNSTLVGNIVSHTANGFWFNGTIELTPEFEPYKDLFKWWSDEDRPTGEEPPFPEDVLENWFVETPEEGKKEIGLPGIYEDQKISWRYF